jgi:hypothetical protein
MLVGEEPKNRLDVTRLSASRAKTQQMAQPAFVPGPQVARRKQPDSAPGPNRD